MMDAEKQVETNEECDLKPKSSSKPNEHNEPKRAASEQEQRLKMKMRAIQQFLSDIMWGELDFLFIDLPPGTGDEPLSVMQLIPDMDGVIIVTIPSEVSQVVVKKAITFAKQQISSFLRDD